MQNFVDNIFFINKHRKVEGHQNLRNTTSDNDRRGLKLFFFIKNYDAQDVLSDLKIFLTVFVIQPTKKCNRQPEVYAARLINR